MLVCTKCGFSGQEEDFDIVDVGNYEEYGGATVWMPIEECRCPYCHTDEYLESFDETCEYCLHYDECEADEDNLGFCKGYCDDFELDIESL